MKENKTFHIKTFGCVANKSDTEIIVGILKKAGYRLTSLKEANHIIINTCGVKRPTEERVIHTLKKMSYLNKNLIIAGCLPKINLDRIKKEISDFSAILDPQSIHKIAEVVRRIENGKKGLIIFSNKSTVKPTLPKCLLNPVIGIVQISEGCNLSCSYCCTRFARGRLQCYTVNEIIKEAKHLIDTGCKELWITSQDNGSYYFDGFRLPELLEKTSRIPGKFFVRVGMMNPSFVKGMIDELVDAYSSEKIFKFLHLPVQSGSNQILKRMNRSYTVKDFKQIIRRFRNEFPMLSLSTDIIVGFPGETETDFRRTMNLIKDVKADIVNISKFGKRPKTKASQMKQLPREIISKRSKKLTETVKKIKLQKNKEWLGWSGEILIDEKTEKGIVGRNYAYKPIVTYGRIGTFKKIEIINSRLNYLVGK